MTITEAASLKDFYVALVESLEKDETEDVLIALDTAIEAIKLPV